MGARLTKSCPVTGYLTKKMHCPAHSGLPSSSSKKMVLFMPYNKPFIEQAYSIWSRWLDTDSLVLFHMFINLHWVSVHKHTKKKSLTNIMPSQLHTWSITHHVTGPCSCHILCNFMISIAVQVVIIHSPLYTISAAL